MHFAINYKTERPSPESAPTILTRTHYPPQENNNLYSTSKPTPANAFF
jgi:hypothetical protein